MSNPNSQKDSKSMAEHIASCTKKMSNEEFELRIKALEEQLRHKDEEIVELQDMLESAKKEIKAVKKA